MLSPAATAVWDPAWDQPEEEAQAPGWGGPAAGGARPPEPPAAAPRDWAAFAADAARRADEAVRAAGAGASSAAPVARSGAALVRGLPAGGRLSCWGCAAACASRLECAQCLDIYRCRALVVARDCWERAFFCTEACYSAAWPEHRARHGASGAGPCAGDARRHAFPPSPGPGALWDGDALKRLTFDLRD